MFFWKVYLNHPLNFEIIIHTVQTIREDKYIYKKNQKLLKYLLFEIWPEYILEKMYKF